MTDDELELSILEKYVARHREAETAEPPATDKCTRELDMREVLRELIGEEGAILDYTVGLWIDRLAPPSSGRSKGSLRRCSNTNLRTSAHKYHARAYRDPVNNASSPAWDRIRELQQKLSAQSPVVPTREFEQKFGILFSVNQEQRDFDTWRAEASSIGVLFVDIDDFKKLNDRYTEIEVDKTILPQAQTLLKQLTTHRGAAYRHGGEEFVVQLPNHNSEEVIAFAEKVRKAFESYPFQIAGENVTLTVSIGVAVCPDHAKTLDELLSASNDAEHRAKCEGRNTVRMATRRHAI